MKKIVCILVLATLTLCGKVFAQDTTNTIADLRFPDVKISKVFEPKNYSATDKEKLKRGRKPEYIISGTISVTRAGEIVKIPVDPITLSGGVRVRVREVLFGGGLGHERLEIVYLPAQFGLKEGDLASVYKITYPGGFIYLATPVNYFK